MTSTQPEQCVNGCGFYGNPQTANYCSKCFAQSAQSACRNNGKPVIPPLIAPGPNATEDDIRNRTTLLENDVQINTNRCWQCNKKVGLVGIKCVCGYVFCATHRHAEKHMCKFDYKDRQKTLVMKTNPLIAPQKLRKI